VTNTYASVLVDIGRTSNGGDVQGEYKRPADAKTVRIAAVHLVGKERNRL
jgi:hypothetical protein